MRAIKKNRKSHLNKKMFFDEGVDVARYDVVKYPQIERICDKQLGFFWRPEEVDILRDANDFKNLTDTTGDGFGDQLINAKDSDGTPDRFVPASRTLKEFRDYQYTANDLVEFNGFQIKVIMTGTNQAYVPRIRDFRSIALA